jgi:hypothetical protein
MGNLRDYTRCWVEERVHWIFVIDLIGRGRAAAERVAVMLLVFPHYLLGTRSLRDLVLDWWWPSSDGGTGLRSLETS